MILTKGLITRAEAWAISPEYVALAADRDWDNLLGVMDAMAKLKRGQEAITYFDGQFVRVKVTKVDHTSFQAIDGPLVRVSNGEFSWRVDGDGNAFPAA